MQTTLNNHLAVRKMMNYHHLVLSGNAEIFKPIFFMPRAAKYDEHGNPVIHPKDKFLITEPMEGEELFTKKVNRYQTHNKVMEQLDEGSRTLVNKIKSFLKGNQVAVYHHDPQQGAAPDSARWKCYRKGSHLHVLVCSQKTVARDLPEYRPMQRKMQDLDCNVYSVYVKEHVDQLVSYLHRPEKEFMGSNSQHLLDLVNENHLKPCVVNVSQFDVEDDKVEIALQNMGKVKPAEDLNLQERQVRTVMEALQRRPWCDNFGELCKQSFGTENHGELLKIYLRQGSEKIFDIAFSQNQASFEGVDLMTLIEGLPEATDRLTPRETLALYNAWCLEQDIDATHLAWELISRLQGRGGKKSGVFFQGRPNSGKTYWTSNLFSQLSHFVGSMSGSSRFMFQSCNKKKIVIGEEVGIDSANVEKFKQLMSGVEVPVEIKNKADGKCKANLVLMNSNQMPFTNVREEKNALMVRMFVHSDLKPSKVLSDAIKGMDRAARPNLQFLSLIQPPDDIELDALNTKVLDYIGSAKDKNQGDCPMFTGSWEDMANSSDILEQSMEADDLDAACQPATPVSDGFSPQSPVYVDYLQSDDTDVMIIEPQAPVPADVSSGRTLLPPEAEEGKPQMTCRQEIDFFLRKPCEIDEFRFSVQEFQDETGPLDLTEAKYDNVNHAFYFRSKEDSSTTVNYYYAEYETEVKSIKQKYNLARVELPAIMMDGLIVQSVSVDLTNKMIVEEGDLGGRMYPKATTTKPPVWGRYNKVTNLSEKLIKPLEFGNLAQLGLFVINNGSTKRIAVKSFPPQEPDQPFRLWDDDNGIWANQEGEMALARKMSHIKYMDDQKRKKNHRGMERNVDMVDGKFSSFKPLLHKLLRLLIEGGIMFIRDLASD